MHAGIDIAPGQRAKLERLCRYVSRPPVAVDRTALTSSGHVRYQLKTSYRDGTTHVVIESLDFMAAGGAGSTAEDAPDALPRRVSTAQQATRSRDADAPGNGCPAVDVPLF